MSSLSPILRVQGVRSLAHKDSVLDLAYKGSDPFNFYPFSFLLYEC